VSAAVRDAIAGKLPASFNELGLRTLKNIEKPIRAYALSARVPSLSSEIPRAAEALPLPSKPSIAVLPFENLSGDRDQDYFADGIVEEIITALSRMRWMFVIARNSSFTYKGRAVDVKQIGREAGVRYILEGSVRKSGNKVRITGQLVDTSTGAHLWADRFEGGLENIFDLQDQVTTSVIGAISPRLEQAEIERAKSKPTENLDGYDYYLRGLAGIHQWTKQSCEEAFRISAGLSNSIQISLPLMAWPRGPMFCEMRADGLRIVRLNLPRRLDWQRWQPSWARMMLLRFMPPESCSPTYFQQLEVGRTLVPGRRVRGDLRPLQSCRRAAGRRVNQRRPYRLPLAQLDVSSLDWGGAAGNSGCRATARAAHSGR
jgi:TolB-like protein